MLTSFAPLMRVFVATALAVGLFHTNSAAAVLKPSPRSPSALASSPVTRRDIGGLSQASDPLLPRAPGKSAGQALVFDNGIGAYTTTANIGGKTYPMILTLGNPNVIMSKSAGYTTGQKTGKGISQAFGSPKKYSVEVVLDSVGLGGMTAQGVAIGNADSDTMIQPKAVTKPVGILGLAPENDAAYAELNVSWKPLVTASGPTPFAITVDGKGGNLQFGQFNTSFSAPLSKKGTLWDVDCRINGVPSGVGATLDPQDVSVLVDDASAIKILTSMGLKTEVIKTENGNVRAAKVDCNKGAPVTLEGPAGTKGQVTVSGADSVMRHEGQCYSILQGYGGNLGFWTVPSQFFRKGVVFDIRGRRVGFAVQA